MFQKRHDMRYCDKKHSKRAIRHHELKRAFSIQKVNEGGHVSPVSLLLSRQPCNPLNKFFTIKTIIFYVKITYCVITHTNLQLPVRENRSNFWKSESNSNLSSYFEEHCAL